MVVDVANEHLSTNRRILRITVEALGQGALLTQADIAILLSESTKPLPDISGTWRIMEKSFQGEAAGRTSVPV